MLGKLGTFSAITCQEEPKECISTLTLEMGSGVFFDPRGMKRVIISISLYVQKQK